MDSELLRLAERVEAATAPDRELDARIAVAIYSDSGHADPRDNTHARFPSPSDECAPGTYWISAFSGLSLRTADPFTASLDAAMTLVPEGWDWSAGTLGNGKGGHSFMRPAGRHYPRVEVDAATPALALTAASLRARAHEAEARG